MAVGSVYVDVLLMSYTGVKNAVWSSFASLVFTALHGMQTRSYDEISVCLSVRPSVCQTRAL